MVDKYNCLLFSQWHNIFFFSAHTCDSPPRIHTNKINQYRILLLAKRLRRIEYCFAIRAKFYFTTTNKYPRVRRWVSYKRSKGMMYTYNKSIYYVLETKPKR